MERVKCSRVSILCSECGVQGGWGVVCLYNGHQLWGGDWRDVGGGVTWGA